MAKDPAFLFYSADFLVGTLLMKDEQVGRYAKLMCLQHQTGHLTEEDMLKICQSHDKDIFDKFKKDDNGLYYNERLEEEVNKRAAFSKSRSDNRLGVKSDTKSPAKTKHVSKQVSNTSKSHVQHMENENTTNNIVDNKGKGLNITNNTVSSGSNSSVKEVFDISSTHDEEVLNSAYSEEIYKLSNGNSDLLHPINVCLWNYFNNTDYSEPRALHCVRLSLDPDPEKCLELLKPWAEAFGRSLVNDGKLTISMSGSRESWLQYFPNWVKKVMESRGKINPDILFTASDVKSAKKEKGKILSGNTTVEDQMEHYKRRTR